MATDRLFDMQGMKIHVCQPYYHLSPRKYLSTQRMHDTCLMSHLVLEADFTTSELRAINWCRISNGITFISDICNIQCNHLQQSETDTFKNFNMIHNFNWPRKHHTTIESRRTWKITMRNLCGGSKYKLHTPLGQWILDDNKYITYWHWLLSRDLHTRYYIEHETWRKYIQRPNQSCRRIEFLTYTKSKSQRPSHSQVCRMSLTISTPTHLQVEATRMDFPPEPSRPPLDLSEEEVTSDLKLCTAFKQTKHRHLWLVSHKNVMVLTGQKYE